MVSVRDVAEYLLWLAQNEDEQLSNLKLQKLLYYAQGHHLARYGVALFDAPIQSWQHGPVIQEIYHAYKKYGSGGIPAPTKVMTHRFRAVEKETINRVFDVYGKFAAWTLRNMTHDEPLWQDTKEGQIMVEAYIREFFLTKENVEPRIVYTQKRTWSEITDELLESRHSLWEKLAQV